MVNGDRGRRYQDSLRPVLTHRARASARSDYLNAISEPLRFKSSDNSGIVIRVCCDMGSRKVMVPGAGLEPARSCEREILSLLCLPIPPLGHRVCYLKHVEC